MKIYVSETEIKVVKNSNVFELEYSTPTQIPNCGGGIGNYYSAEKKEKMYISKEIYDLIKNNELKKVPTSALDKMNLRWFDRAYDIINDYVVLKKIFEKNKKNKNL